MGEFLNAVVGFPAMLFTAALIVVAGFWLLVLCGVAERDGFDADVDTRALSLGGVPVSVAASLFVVAGWLVSVGGTFLLGRADLPGFPSHLLAVVLLLVAPLLSWLVTRGLVGPLARLFPDEPGRSPTDVAALSGPPERDRSAALGQRRVAVPVRRGR